MFTPLKKLIATLTNRLRKPVVVPAPEAPAEATPSLGERFNLAMAPTPTEAEDAAVMGTDAQTLDYEAAAVLARAASEKYGTYAVHVDPATARVRVSEQRGNTPWFWAETD